MQYNRPSWLASVIIGIGYFLALGTAAFPQASAAEHLRQSSSQQMGLTPVAASDLGVSFVDGSTSEVIIQRNGKNYVVDLVSHEVREVPASNVATATSSSRATSTATAADPPADPDPPAKKDSVYKPGDDLVFNVPTGRRIDRHGLYLDFTHRFPFEPAFTSPGRGNTLLGLDDFAIPSFGLRYGVTSKLSVLAYRSPSVLNRPIELMAAYNFLDEHDGNPLNAAIRFSVDGQNNFSKNFTENLELVVSRSLGRRAQLYAVPTYSYHNRPLFGNLNSTLTAAIPDQPCGAASVPALSPAFSSARPCANTFSLGMAAAVDIRPTVALITEVTPTLVNGRDLAIHRPEYGFGIQKKIWRHAFTLGFSNGPGSVVSQRAGTRATLLQDPKADKPSGLFIGFDLTRQVF